MVNGMHSALALLTGDVAADTPNALLQLVPNLVLFIGIMVAFYFLLIRPQRKKEQSVKKMLNELKPGDRITTIGGIYGTVAQLKDDTVTLIVGPDKVKIIFARWAIRSVDTVSDVENDIQEIDRKD